MRHTDYSIAIGKNLEHCSKAYRLFEKHNRPMPSMRSFTLNASKGDKYLPDSHWQHGGSECHPDLLKLLPS